MAAFILELYLWLFSILCFSRAVSEFNLTCQKIDSLIEIRELNKQAVLISFGADALTAINSAAGIIVIDAGISRGLTARYRKVIEQKFGRKDFIYVINTHAHPDHYGGNNIFNEAEVIAHLNSLQEISSQSKGVEKRVNALRRIANGYNIKLRAVKPGMEEWQEFFIQKTRYLNAYYDALDSFRINLPDITFQDSLKINTGDTVLEMLYFGKCHSDSDILIYIPKMKILFSGDLFSRYGRPAFDDILSRDSRGWFRAIKWIEKRLAGTDKIITGHGEILSTGDIKSFNDIMLKKCGEKNEVFLP